MKTLSKPTTLDQSKSEVRPSPTHTSFPSKGMSLRFCLQPCCYNRVTSGYCRSCEGQRRLARRIRPR
jgi:hypothetical protein